MSEDAEFRSEVRTWLAENLTPELRDVTRKAVSVFIDKPYNLAWQRKLNENCSRDGK